MFLASLLQRSLGRFTVLALQSWRHCSRGHDSDFLVLQFSGHNSRFVVLFWLRSSYGHGLALRLWPHGDRAHGFRTHGSSFTIPADIVLASPGSGGHGSGFKAVKA